MSGDAGNAVQPLDVRLASAALAGWVGLAMLLSCSADVAAAVAAAALVGAVACLLRRSPARSATRTVGLALAVLALLAGSLAVRVRSVEHGELAVLAASHASVELDVVLSGDPKQLASSGPGGQARSSVAAMAVRVRSGGGWSSASGRVLVLGVLDDWQGLAPGQHIRVVARLAPARVGTLTAAIAQARGSPTLFGDPPWWQRAASTVRDGLRRACSGLPRLVRGLLPGLVDGDTSALDPVLVERFRTAGLTHLVAVSGTNLAITVAAVTLVLSRVGVSPRVRAVVGVLLVVAFVVLARPSASVLRAAAMAVIALSGGAMGRPRQALPLLSAAVVALLGWHPELARDIGFTLSVLATGALITVAPSWAEALARRGVPVGLAESVAVAAAAHVVTAPVIVGFSGSVSLIAVPANLIAEPVVAPATVLGLLAAVLSTCAMPVASACAQLAGVSCRWLISDAEFFGSLPGGSLPWPTGWGGAGLLVLVTAGVWWSARRRRGRALVAVAAVIGATIQIPVRSMVTSWPPPGWLFIACDIGQGDGLVLSTAPHGGGPDAVVIDTGPEPVAMDRCLTELGVRRIPLLVLTHDHLDHVGGIVGVEHNRTIGQILTSPLADPVSGATAVADAGRRQSARVQIASPGTTLVAGALRLDVLGPLRVARSTRSDPNNSSVVLRATLGGVRILLPGDAEVEEQDDLLATGVDLRADVLKVPHHGSAWSDPAFLADVHARVAIVSVGAHNDYGHPSPLLVDDIAKLGIPLLRTDEQGDVAMAASGATLRPVVRRQGGSSAAGARRGPPDVGGDGDGGDRAAPSSAGGPECAGAPDGVSGPHPERGLGLETLARGPPASGEPGVRGRRTPVRR